jgi:hypothetical protein
MALTHTISLSLKYLTGELMAKRKQFFSKIFVIYSLLLLFFFLVLAGIFFFRNREILHEQAKAQRAIFTEQARDRIDLGVKIVNGIIVCSLIVEMIESYYSFLMREMNIDVFATEP